MNAANLIRQHWAALRALLVLTVILGLGYPLLIWLIAQIPGLKQQADGSILQIDGKPLGSSLIGQSFTDSDGNALPQYFQSRPSAAGDGYDPLASGASNLGPENILDTPGKPSLLTLICQRSMAVGKLEGVSGARPFCTGDGAAPAQPVVPADAVTASGSGLDPHISPAYADLQIGRVARVRGVSAEDIRSVVAAHTDGRTLGVFGEPRVNVLELNLDLDAKYPLKN